MLYSHQVGNLSGQEEDNGHLFTPWKLPASQAQQKTPAGSQPCWEPTGAVMWWPIKWKHVVLRPLPTLYKKSRNLFIFLLLLIFIFCQPLEHALALHIVHAVNISLQSTPWTRWEVHALGLNSSHSCSFLLFQTFSLVFLQVWQLPQPCPPCTLPSLTAQPPPTQSAVGTKAPTFATNKWTLKQGFLEGPPWSQEWAPNSRASFRSSSSCWLWPVNEDTLWPPATCLQLPRAACLLTTFCKMMFPLLWCTEQNVRATSAISQP